MANMNRTGTIWQRKTDGQELIIGVRARIGNKRTGPVWWAMNKKGLRKGTIRDKTLVDNYIHIISDPGELYAQYQNKK